MPGFLLSILKFSFKTTFYFLKNNSDTRMVCWCVAKVEFTFFIVAGIELCFVFRAEHRVNNQ